MRSTPEAKRGRRRKIKKDGEEASKGGREGETVGPTD